MSGLRGAPVALLQSHTLRASNSILPAQISLPRRFVKVLEQKRNVKKFRKEKYHLKISAFSVEKPLPLHTLMLTKVQKWGNSLALRIPKAFAVDAQLEKDSFVEISVVRGKIIITPVSAPGWTLEELLEGITKDNLHNEFDTGFAIENEVW